MKQDDVDKTSKVLKQIGEEVSLRADFHHAHDNTQPVERRTHAVRPERPLHQRSVERESVEVAFREDFKRAHDNTARELPEPEHGSQQVEDEKQALNMRPPAGFGVAGLDSHTHWGNAQRDHVEARQEEFRKRSEEQRENTPEEEKKRDRDTGWE